MNSKLFPPYRVLKHKYKRKITQIGWLNYSIQDKYVAWFDVGRQKRQFDVFMHHIRRQVSTLKVVFTIWAQDLSLAKNSNVSQTLPADDASHKASLQSKTLIGVKFQSQKYNFCIIFSLNSSIQNLIFGKKGLNSILANQNSNNQSIEKEFYRAFSFSPTFSKYEYFLNLWNLADNMFQRVAQI